MGGTSTDVCLITGRGCRSGRASASLPGCRFAFQPWTSTRLEQEADRSRCSTRAERCESARQAPAPIRGRPATGAAERSRRSPTRISFSADCPHVWRGASNSTGPRPPAPSGHLTRRQSSRVVNAEMLRALRVVSVERGLDPRDFVLVAFGGAGPLHACALADELGIGTVLIPDRGRRSVGARSRRQRRTARPRRKPSLCRSRRLESFRLGGEVDLRYRGQSFELTVPLEDDLARAFHRAHEERYGYADTEREIELVAVRTAEVRRGPVVELPQARPLRVTGPRVLELRGRHRASFPRGGWGFAIGPRTLVVTKA